MMLYALAQFDPSALFPLAFWMPSGGEWIILLVIALLIFGRRLPEVGRWLGQGIVEFKKGVKGIHDEIDEATDDKRPTERLADQSQLRSQSQSTSHQPSQREEQTVPRSGGQSEEKHHLER